jgi:hypothetical protein
MHAEAPKRSVRNAIHLRAMQQKDGNNITSTIIQGKIHRFSVLIVRSVRRRLGLPIATQSCTDAKAVKRNKAVRNTQRMI